MCEANAYLAKNGKEELLLESVDLVEPMADGSWRLLSIFGEQKLVKGRIRRMNLNDHKLFFEPWD